MTQVKPADGLRGHILYLHGLNKYCFRVYTPDNPNEPFVDYDIHHCDLTVTIDDPDAYLYRADGKDRLDHSPETLGLKIT